MPVMDSDDLTNKYPKHHRSVTNRIEKFLDDSQTVKDENFNFPIALTQQVWERYVVWFTEDSNNQIPQDTAIRLTHILEKLKAIQEDKATIPTIFQLWVIPRDGHSKSPKAVELKAVISDGDNTRPVITIMLPNEDKLSPAK